MLNIRSALDSYGIDCMSPSGAVQDIRKLVDLKDPSDQLNFIQVVSQEVFGMSIPATGRIAARIVLQYALNTAVKLGGWIGNKEELMAEAVRLASAYVSDQRNHVHWINAERGACSFAEEQHVQHVAVQKSADEILASPIKDRPKRGEKKVLVERMFVDNVINGTPPMSRKQFLELIIQDPRIQMTKSGGNTYAHNMKHAFAAKLMELNINW